LSEQQPRDLIVIGGGAVGMLSARQFARAGRRVTLLERDRPGHGTSRAGGGIMSPLAPWTAPEAVRRLAARSLPMLPQLAEALIQSTGTDPEYRESGIIYLDCDDAESAQAYARDAGLRCEVLDRAGLGRLAPAARSTDGPSVWFPDVAQIRNPRFLDALAADLVARGVEILDRAGPVRLEAGDGSVRINAGRHGILAAADVVVAAGAWSQALLGLLGMALPVRPVRGQIVWYLLPRPSLSQVLMRGGHYVIPRQDGVVLVGSTVEEVGFDLSTTEEAGAELRDAAAEIMPLLGALAAQGQWAGLRPGSPGGVPMIGAVPGFSGLWLNTGHFRNGVNLAPASAELLAALVGGEAPPIDPAPYDPARQLASPA
jgi:glycine oxidase